MKSDEIFKKRKRIFTMKLIEVPMQYNIQQFYMKNIYTNMNKYLLISDTQDDFTIYYYHYAVTISLCTGTMEKHFVNKIENNNYIETPCL